MLCIDGLFIISSVPHELNELMWLNGYLAFDKISCICLCDIFMYMWLHCPMVLFIVSTICIIFECWFISGLVKSIFERSFSGKKSQFLSEVVFAVTFGIYLSQPWYILSVNRKNEQGRTNQKSRVGTRWLQNSEVNSYLNIIISLYLDRCKILGKGWCS